MLTIVVTIAVAVFGGVLAPCVAWLVKEVLNLRVKIAAIEEKVARLDLDGQRQQKWLEGVNSTMGRLDRNVAKLCQHAGVAEGP